MCGLTDIGYVGARGQNVQSQMEKGTVVSSATLTYFQAMFTFFLLRAFYLSLKLHCLTSIPS